MANKNDVIDMVGDMVEKKLSMFDDVDQLYKEFIGMTNVERAHEETFVVSEIMKGTSKSKIIEMLKQKHPELTFSYQDLEKFMVRNDEIVSSLSKEKRMLARRHLDSREKVSDAMASLALYVRKMIPEMEKGEKTQDKIAAIRALKDVYESYAKIEGFYKSEGTTNVNIIQGLSENRSHKLRRVADADYDIIEEDDDE